MVEFTININPPPPKKKKKKKKKKESCEILQDFIGPLKNIIWSHL